MPPKKRREPSTANGGTKSSQGVVPPPTKSQKISVADVELLSKAYGVTFPKDLYMMWNFCCELNKNEPLKALSSIDLQLVGPFQVLSNDLSVAVSNSINYHLHWRFYYDPPELMTVMVSTNPNKNPFHIGFLRDDPKDEKCIVVSNTGEDCKIEIMGDNLFCAVNKLLSDNATNAKGKAKTALQHLLKNLQAFAKAQNIDMQARSIVEGRHKNIVDFTFHGAGIVVPIDDNEVGYRPVGETPKNLKKIFQKIDVAPDDEMRMAAFDGLQEVITYVQLANDECDFGMGLELGMQMFCFGSRYLDKAAGRMLSMAYHLLKRHLYQKIIEQHISDRRKENYQRIPESR